MKMRWKNGVAFLALLAMLASLAVVPTEAGADNSVGVCEHHPQHTADCGYVEGTAAVPCDHAHTEACFVNEVQCNHVHDGSCLAENEPMTPALRTVAEKAVAAAVNKAGDSLTDVDGDGVADTDDDKDGLSDLLDPEIRRATADAPSCPHVCTVESGCIERVPNRCSHVCGDGTCAYQPAVAAQPCTYVCEICGGEADDGESGEVTPPVTSDEDASAGDEDNPLDTDEPALPETCICETRCTEDAMNADCPVCGADGAGVDDCQGEGAAPTCICTEPCSEGYVNPLCAVCSAEGAVLAAVCLPAAGANNSLLANGGYYKAYNFAPNLKGMMDLRVREADDFTGATERSVYCFNYNRHAPDFYTPYSSGVSPYIKYENASNNDFVQMADNERYSSALRQKVSDVVWNGYPYYNGDWHGIDYDYAGYFGNDTSMYYLYDIYVTQRAVWYYSDSNTYSGSTARLVEELLESAARNPAPPDFTLDLYDATYASGDVFAKGYQNLLGVQRNQADIPKRVQVTLDKRWVTAEGESYDGPTPALRFEIYKGTIESGEKPIRTIDVEATADGGNKRYTFSALNTGETYTIREVLLGMTQTFTTDGDQILDLSQSQPGVSFTNVYQPTGKIELTKDVVGEAIDKKKVFDFLVTLEKDGIPYDGKVLLNGEPAVLDDGKVDVHLRDDETAVLSSLPVGVTFKVQELLPGDYELMEVHGSEGLILEDAQTVSGRIDAPQSLKMVFHNMKKEADKMLVIGKVVNNLPADVEAEGFDLNVKLYQDEAMREPYSGTYTLTEGGEPMAYDAAEGIRLEDVRQGTPRRIGGLGGDMYYEITEILSDSQKAQYRPLENVVSGKMTEDNTFVTYQNEFIGPQSLSLELSKKVAGLETDEAFSFIVALRDKDEKPLPATVAVEPEGQATFLGNGRYQVHLTGDERVRFSGLPRGYGYEIIESASVHTVVDDVTIEAPETAEIDESARSVSQDGIYAETTAVTFTNQVSATQLALTIDKAWVDRHGEPYDGERPDAVFEIYKDEITGELLKTVTISAGETSAVVTLPDDNASRYIVREVTGGSDSVFQVEKNDQVLDMSSIGDKETTLSFTNVYAPEGALILSKEAVGIPEGTSLTFDFHLTLQDESGAPYVGTFQRSSALGEGGDTVTYDSEKGYDVQLKHGEQVVLSALPEGTTFTVQEQTLPEGYMLHAINGVVKDAVNLEERTAQGVIHHDTPTRVAYVNAIIPEPETVSLVVQKNVEGAPSTTTPFKFKVSLFKDEAMSQPYDGTYALNGAAEPVDYDAGQGIVFELADSERAIIVGLAQDTYYKIEEVGEYKDYTLAKPQTGFLQEDSQWLEMVNTYTGKDVRQLTLKKVVTGEPVGDVAFEFLLTFRDADGKMVEGLTADGAEAVSPGKYRVNLKGGEQVTFEGLPKGYFYHIEEITPKQLLCDVEISAPETAFVSGTTVTDFGVQAENFDITYTNDIQPDASLRIAKKVTQPQLPEDSMYHFALTLYENGVPLAQGTVLDGMIEKADGRQIASKMTVGENGAATFVLAADETLILEPLAQGVYTYSVSELEADAYDTVIEASDKNAVIDEATRTASQMKTALAGDATLTFTNSLRPTTGALSLEKLVNEETPDANAVFNFTVTLTMDGKPLSGTFDGVTFDENGTATVALHHGETRTIGGLPEGTTYQVIEEDASGYDLVAAENDDGVIKAAQTLTARFINQKHAPETEPYSLRVEKTVGGDGDRERDWHFEVRLSDTGINGRYGDMTFTDGMATFTLKDGEVRTATNLPKTVTYRVTETDADKDGHTTFADGESGVLSADGAVTASFLNYKTPPILKDDSGDLLVKKSVTGTGGDRSKEWHFTVTLADTSINGYRGEMFFENGVAVFTLKDGEEMLAMDLPKNVAYTVTEKEANQNGYSTTSTNAKGTILDAAVTEAVFVNDKPSGGIIIPDPEPAVVQLNAEKTMDGKSPDKDDTFRFVLKDENGKVIETVENDGKDIRFAPLRFNRAGTYVYTVSEQAGQNSAVNYDEKVYKAVVKVTRDGRSYEAALSYSLDGVAIKGTPLFTNTTKATEPDTITVTANKVWRGSGAKPTDIEVQLYRDDKPYGDAVTLNADNGWQTSWSGLDKTHAWRVDEVKVPSGYTKTLGHIDNDWTITNTRLVEPSKPSNGDGGNTTKTTVKTGSNRSTPATGDSSHTALWAMVALVSLGGMGTLLLVTRRRKENDR